MSKSGLTGKSQRTKPLTKKTSRSLPEVDDLDNVLELSQLQNKILEISDRLESSSFFEPDQLVDDLEIMMRELNGVWDELKNSRE